MKTVRIMVVIFALCIPIIALAFTMQGGETVNITTPVSDDLYVAGNSIGIESIIHGDLIMAGGDLSSEWSVSESIMAAGGNLNFSWRVGDDIRAVGGNIRLESSIGGDVILAGGNITMGRNANVAKDLAVAGGNILLDGTINGKAEIAGGKISLNGTIGKNVHIVSEDVTIGSGARILGSLVYESSKPQPMLEAIVSGTKEFKQMTVSTKNIESARESFLGVVFSYILFKILFLTLFGFLLLVTMEKYIRETSDILTESPWMSLFTGISFFILVPFVVILLMFTIIGIPVGILMMAVMCFVFAFYELIGTVVWASWTMDQYMKGMSDSWWRKLLVIFGFAILFGVIAGIDIIPAWMAIGALLTRHWRLFQSIRK